MHIVHLISNLRFGGAQKIAVGLAEESRNRGHRVSIVTISSGNDYSRRLTAAGVEYRSLDYERRLSFANLFHIAGLRKRLLQNISDLNPSVIHSHLFAPKIVLYGLRSVAGCPVVETQHDNPPWWRMDDVNSRIRRHIDRVFLRRTASCTAAISKSVHEDLQRLFDHPPEACPVIYNFIDQPPHDLSEHFTSHLPPTVLMVTRLDIEKKGLDTAIKVFAGVRSRIPDAILELVGDGPDAAKIKTLAKDYDITGSVKYHGYQEDVYQFFARADVLLMPSRWEGFGVSAAEAGVSGVPVVAARVGGLQEVVIDGQTGFTCDSEDVDQMTDRVIRLLEDSDLRQRMSDAAKTSSSNRFSVVSAFDQYERIYEKARVAA